MSSSFFRASGSKYLLLSSGEWSQFERHSPALFHSCRRRQSTDQQHNYDVAVIGGGIVGCATARQLLIRHPQLRLVLVDKENRLAAHQSGNNSGVVHAGIYYLPGSLKAKLCVKGLDMSYEYFEQERVPYKKPGKLIVAVNDAQVPRLKTLFDRAKQNGCRNIEMIDGPAIQDIEPHCRGVKALWSPETGIVDWGSVTRSLGDEIRRRGATVITDFHVKQVSLTSSSNEHKLQLIPKDTAKPVLTCDYAIACAGLQSDRVAQLTGCSSLPKILPFRGEYLLLKENKRHLVRGNIYPVPDPSLPFLGVHFTPRMNGDILLGPNAVLAFRREGYGYGQVNLKDMFEALTFTGMQHLMLKHFMFGAKELYRGINTRAQVAQLKRYVPELTSADVVRGPTGVRAQAVDAGGRLVDDFVFDVGQGAVGKRVLHVRNAPSPAATSSLAIAEMVVERAEKIFNRLRVK